MRNQEIDLKKFIEALDAPSLEKMKNLPKCDMHSHAGRGGRISYLEKVTGVSIVPYNGVFHSLEEMNTWIKKNVISFLPKGLDNYRKRVEASFIAAVEDNVVRLALDFGLGEVFAFGGVESFAKEIDYLKHINAPDIEFIPVMAIYGKDGLAYLEEIFEYRWFKAIDIINYDNQLSLDIMKLICDLAKTYEMKCKAHVGEYGTADDVYQYVKELGLDEVQHGIQVVNSESILSYFTNSAVIFNVCPTSNVMLGRCKCYEKHPIKKMIEYGLKVTVNTDDLLIFDSTVSEEFRLLYNNKVLTGSELYQIYKNGFGEE